MVKSWICPVRVGADRDRTFVQGRRHPHIILAPTTPNNGVELHMQSLFASNIAAARQPVVAANLEPPRSRSRANVLHDRTQLVPCDGFAFRFAARFAARGAVGECFFHTRPDEDHPGESGPGE